MEFRKPASAMARKGIGAQGAEVILGPILNADIQTMDECSAELCLWFLRPIYILRSLNGRLLWCQQGNKEHVLLF